MYAVIRETRYAPDLAIHQTQAFQQFQKEHAGLPGYVGTVVADAGGGRVLTLTLWQTADHMHGAREAMGPVVQRHLNPLMTSPAKLLGTGRVLWSDLSEMSRSDGGC